MENAILHGQLLTIREAQVGDADELSALVVKNINDAHVGHYTREELRIWERGYSKSAYEQQILGREVFVLQYQGLIGGTVQLEKCEIKGFYTQPRGIGFGNILMGFMLAHLKLKGHGWIELTSNEWAVRFYEKHLFKVVGKETVHWEGHPFEEYRMRRELPSILGTGKIFI